MSRNPSQRPNEIPMYHINTGYTVDDEHLTSLDDENIDDYIDPSKWINQQNRDTDAYNPAVRPDAYPRQNSQSLRHRNHHQPISMDLINELPSRNLCFAVPENAEDKDSTSSGIVRAPSDSKHATLRFHSALRRGDVDEDYMFNMLTADTADTSEEHVKEVLRGMNQSLTLKRSVKARISRTQSQRDQLDQQRNVPCGKRLTSRFHMAWKHLKREFREITHSLDLWHTHLKTIQGHFGSGVASYFFFLRWLFFMNLFSFVIIICFVVTPQLIWQENIMPANSTSSKSFTGWELLTGTGMFENTVMYYGFYTTQSVGSYKMPEAYIFGSSAYIIFSIVLLTYSLAQSYKRNYIISSGELKNIYANKVFSAWDYSIEKEEAAKKKSRSIYNELLELLASEIKVVEEKTFCQKFCLYFWRAFVNFFILAVIAATAYLVFFLLKNKYVKGVNIAVLSEMTLALAVTVIIYMVPLFFRALSYLEKYSNKQTQFYLNMFRIVLLRVIILGVVTYFWLDRNQDSGKRPLTDGKECWETELGQEVYRLIIVDLFCILFFSTLVMEFFRNLLYKYCQLPFVGNPEFDIAQNTLDLVYTQMLTWVGFFYCPLLPLIAGLKFVIVFYTKRLSVVFNCQPSQKPWRAAHAQTIFLFLTFSNFLLALVSLGYSILQIKPSEECGPFSGMESRYDVVLRIMNETKSAEIFDYLLSPGVVSGFLLFLCVVLYYMRATAKANKEMVDLLRDQLILEGKDKVFLLRLYDGAMQYRNMSLARKNKQNGSVPQGSVKSKKRDSQAGFAGPSQTMVVNEIYEDYEHKNEPDPNPNPNNYLNPPGRRFSELPVSTGTNLNQPKPGWGRERTPDFIGQDAASLSSRDSVDFNRGMRNNDDSRRSSQRNSPFSRISEEGGGLNERRANRRRQGPPPPLVPHAQGFQYLTQDNPSYSPTRTSRQNTPQRF